MKTKLLLLLLLLATATFAQTIHRVNNNPGVTGTNIYTTIQAAHDAAVGGDIIYIESSVAAYGGLVCTKQLTIIGPGYLLNQNLNLQASTSNAITSAAITFGAGSSGSSLLGFQVDYNGYVYVGANVSNIIIKGCKLSYVWLSRPTTVQSYSNIVISQNILYGIFDDNITPGQGTPPSPAGTVTGVEISNNIMLNGAYLNNQYSGNITNNTFSGGGGSMNMIVSNFAMINNIWSTTGGTISGSNNNTSNNVASGAQFGTADGNLANVNMVSVFVGDPNNPGSLSQDGIYKIKVGSPTIGAGFNGEDCGAFGGTDPYVLSGIPPYPTINKLTTSGIGNSTIPISVTISTKSNN